nr:reverse transcriptase domain, reverse transcriptase zinc-binding domain protein [Tanacetum cinerariifolium]
MTMLKRGEILEQSVKEVNDVEVQPEIDEVLKSPNDHFELVMNEDCNGNDEADTKMDAAWNDPTVRSIKTSFLNMVTNDKPKPKINFRSLVNKERAENYDFVLPIEAITTTQNRVPMSSKVTMEAKEADEDGFKTISNRQKKCKNQPNASPKQNKGLKMNKPKVTVVWKKVNQTNQKPNKVTYDMEDINLIKLKNNIDALRDQDNLIREVNVGETSGSMNDLPTDLDPNSLSYESELEKMIMEPDPRVKTTMRASTPFEDVFRLWDWTFNASLCDKGCRIIVGWNIDVVDLMVIAQTDQAMHVKVIHKNTKQALLSDLNVALNSEDYYSGSSIMTSNMIEFKDCVSKIDMMDINSMCIRFTWNQKPKGGGGGLRSLIVSWVISSFVMLSKDLTLREEEAIYLQTFNEAKLDEERFYKQKAKIEWLDVGNSNSMYFHKYVKFRNQRCRVKIIRNKHNEDFLGPNVAEAFVSHYKIFLDDLSLFACGDVDSACVIIESLDEFKSTIGLIPSTPKRTAFFCNVINHVKMAILSIMPFSEGELAVKYLGVPLIYFRLLNRGCEVLVESAKNRIGDWKNKSLSFAMRL